MVFLSRRAEPEEVAVRFAVPWLGAGGQLLLSGAVRHSQETTWNLIKRQLEIIPATSLRLRRKAYSFNKIGRADDDQAGLKRDHAVLAWLTTGLTGPT